MTVLSRNSTRLRWLTGGLLFALVVGCGGPNDAPDEEIPSAGGAGKAGQVAAGAGPTAGTGNGPGGTSAQGGSQQNGGVGGGAGQASGGQGGSQPDAGQGGAGASSAGQAGAAGVAGTGSGGQGSAGAGEAGKGGVAQGGSGGSPIAGAGGASGEAGQAGASTSSCFAVGGKTICLQSDKAGADPKSTGFGVVPMPPGGIPSSASLDESGFVIPDQGACGSCVAFAVSNAMGLKNHDDKSSDIRFSAPHVWFSAGYGADDCDHGSFIHTVFSQMGTKGIFIVPDSIWPYDSASPAASLLNIPDASLLDANGKAYILSGIGISSQNTVEIKAAITQRWPAVIGVPVYSNASWDISGLIDLPAPQDKFRGNHAITIVGFDDATQRFRFANSWSSSWGEQGYGYLSYDYVATLSDGGMALTEMHYKEDCPKTYCSDLGLSSGTYCNGTGPGSSSVTCGVHQGCAQVIKFQVCPTGCAGGSCISCSDGVKNGNETDIDCGGSCGPCAGTCGDGQQNQGEAGVDCGGPCPACSATCSDGVQNQSEAGIDCGGPCPACDLCSNGAIDPGETKIDCGGSCPACAATCSDGQQNQSEQGVDCGGPCPKCPESCTDGAQNQGETGVDCGGPCAPCPPSCADGIQNQDETGVDCGGSSCQACAPTCTDGIQNGGETGIDCGGICIPCMTCSDGVQNQGEEGVDCGGPCFNLCPTCSDGQQNQGEEGIDCGGPCFNLCSTCNDGIQNGGETGVDCGGSCAPCASCTDGIQNQGETGVDCGGPCAPCTSINTVTPTSATLNQQTTFTVSGTGLPSTLAWFIPNCVSSNGLQDTAGNASQRTFSCTPSNNATGPQQGQIKDKPGGTVLFNFSVNVQSGITVTSVTPASATLNQQTTFTVSGSGLPSTLAWFIPNCVSSNGLQDTSGNTTQRTFSCTPSNNATGVQQGQIKDKPGGTVLFNFSVNVNPASCSSPTVTSVTPTSATLNQLKTFTINGSCLPSTTVWFIPECTSSNGQQTTTGSSTQRTFSCTPQFSKGTKASVIKDKSGGTTLFNFNVTVN